MECENVQLRLPSLSPSLLTLSLFFSSSVQFRFKLWNLEASASCFLLLHSTLHCPSPLLRWTPAAAAVIPRPEPVGSPGVTVVGTAATIRALKLRELARRQFSFSSLSPFSLLLFQIENPNPVKAPLLFPLAEINTKLRISNSSLISQYHPLSLFGQLSLCLAHLSIFSFLIYSAAVSLSSRYPPPSRSVCRNCTVVSFHGLTHRVQIWTAASLHRCLSHAAAVTVCRHLVIRRQPLLLDAYCCHSWPRAPPRRCRRAAVASLALLISSRSPPSPRSSRRLWWPKPLLQHKIRRLTQLLAPRIKTLNSATHPLPLSVLEFNESNVTSNCEKTCSI